MRQPTQFEEEMYEALTASLGTKKPGAVVSRQAFQRNQRIGFVCAGRVFEMAIERGALVRTYEAGLAVFTSSTGT